MDKANENGQPLLAANPEGDQILEIPTEQNEVEIKQETLQIPPKKKRAHSFIDVDDIVDIKAGATRRLWWVSIICVIFMAAEIVGGIWAGSLAILTDAAHLGSECLGFNNYLLNLKNLVVTEQDDYNVQAAAIHILGDLVQISVSYNSRISRMGIYKESEFIAQFQLSRSA